MNRLPVFAQELRQPEAWRCHALIFATYLMQVRFWSLC